MGRWGREGGEGGRTREERGGGRRLQGLRWREGWNHTYTAMTPPFSLPSHTVAATTTHTSPCLCIPPPPLTRVAQLLVNPGRHTHCMLPVLGSNWWEEVVGLHTDLRLIWGKGKGGGGEGGERERREGRTAGVENGGGGEVTGGLRASAGECVCVCRICVGALLWVGSRCVLRGVGAVCLPLFHPVPPLTPSLGVPRAVGGVGGGGKDAHHAHLHASPPPHTLHAATDYSYKAPSTP